MSKVKNIHYRAKVSASRGDIRGHHTVCGCAPYNPLQNVLGYTFRNPPPPPPPPPSGSVSHLHFTCILSSPNQSISFHVGMWVCCSPCQVPMLWTMLRSCVCDKWDNSFVILWSAHSSLPFLSPFFPHTAKASSISLNHGHIVSYF